MKANKLMIGDLVNTPDGISRVIYIAKYSGIYTDNTNVGEKLYSPYEINPLPLTPEILEKNGFECNQSTKTFYRYFSDNGITVVEIRLWEEDTNIRIGYQSDSTFRVGYDWVINGIKIQFVHELQQVLRLCGIEKTIEL